MPPVENAAFVNPVTTNRIIPDLEPSLVKGNTLDQVGNDEFKALATNVAASQTVTISGVPTTNDTVTIVLVGAGKTLSVTHTLSAGDAASVTTAALAVGKTINLSALNTLVTAASVAGVITLTAINAGQGGNSVGVTASKTGVLAIAQGGAVLAGGTGQITPQISGGFPFANQMVNLVAGRPLILDSRVVSALIAANVPML
mgnify:CR=1 FL=1